MAVNDGCQGLKTMAHFINATGEVVHNEMYIHIVF